MKVAPVLALAIHAASVIAAPVATPGTGLAKESIIIKSTDTYKRDTPALEKDSIIIKSAVNYKRDEKEKREAADLAKDSIIIKSDIGY